MPQQVFMVPTGMLNNNGRAAAMNMQKGVMFPQMHRMPGNPDCPKMVSSQGCSGRTLEIWGGLVYYFLGSSTRRAAAMDVEANGRFRWKCGVCCWGWANDAPPAVVTHPW